MAGRRGCAHQVLALDFAKTISFRDLVDIAKMRWRIERDYQELKQEIGLGHYEGRGWRGFHHHGTLCIAAYGFLISERETIPPSAPRSAGMLAKPALPAGYRPRGAADPAPTPRPQLDRDHPSVLSSRSPERCRDARAAPADSHETCDVLYDAVQLVGITRGVMSTTRFTTPRCRAKVNCGFVGWCLSQNVAGNRDREFSYLVKFTFQRIGG